VRIGVSVLFAGLVLALTLGATPSLAGEAPGEVIAASATPSCFGFIVESLAAAVTGCLPASDISLSQFAPAADGAVAFVGGTDNTDPTAGGQGPIWLLRPDGSQVKLDSSVWDYAPSISYDGSRIAFARFDPTTWSSDIYSVNADGSDFHLVASGGGTNDLTVPTISPDGSTIAYWCGPARHAASAGQGCGPLTDGTYRNSGAMRVNVAGTDGRMISIGAGGAFTPGGPGSLSWSADGQWLTMDGLAGDGCATGNGATCLTQVFAYRTDGSDLFNNSDPSRQITHETDQYGAGVPQFCGDSTSILYLAEGGWNLIDLDGGNQTKIVFSPEGNAMVACIPPAVGEGPPPLVDMTHITVPSVHTLRLKAAKSALAADNLTVGTVKYKYSAKLRKNHILSQYPRAGAVAHRTDKIGPSVNLVVSRGRHPRRHR